MYEIVVIEYYGGVVGFECKSGEVVVEYVVVLGDCVEFFDCFFDDELVVFVVNDEIVVDLIVFDYVVDDFYVVEKI